MAIANNLLQVFLFINIFCGGVLSQYGGYGGGGWFEPGRGETRCREHKCASDSKCVSLDRVCDRREDCRFGDDEGNCEIRRCPNFCTCRPIANRTEFLNTQCLNGWHPDIVAAISRTTDILELSGGLFESSSDSVGTLRSKSFSTHTDLNTLLIKNNSLTDVEHGAFHGLERLRTLDMSNNLFTRFEWHTFRGLYSLHTLILRNIPLMYTEGGTFSSFGVIQKVYVDLYLVCCNFVGGSYHHKVICVSNKDVSEHADCSRVLKNRSRVILAALVGILAILFSSFVLMLISKRALIGKEKEFESIRVQCLLMWNLAIASLIIGAYMLSMVVGDMWSGPMFFYNKKDWIESIQCHISGFLYLAATEASILFIMVISVDQYMKMKPYKDGYAGFPGYTGGFVTLDGDCDDVEGALKKSGKDHVQNNDKNGDVNTSGLKQEKVNPKDKLGNGKEDGVSNGDTDSKVVIITDNINLKGKDNRTSEEEIGLDLPAGYPAKMISFRQSVYISIALWSVSVLFGLIGTVSLSAKSDVYDLSRFCIGIPLFRRPGDTDMMKAGSVSHPAFLRTVAVFFLLIDLACFVVTVVAYFFVSKILKRLDRELTLERRKQKEIMDEEKAEAEKLAYEEELEEEYTKEKLEKKNGEVTTKLDDDKDKTTSNGGDKDTTTVEEDEKAKPKTDGKKQPKVENYKNFKNFKLGATKYTTSMRASGRKKKTPSNDGKSVGDGDESAAGKNADADSKTESDAEVDYTGKKINNKEEKNDDEGGQHDTCSNAETNGSSRKADDDAVSYNSSVFDPEEDQIVLQASEMDTLIFLNCLCYMPVVIIGLLSQCGVPIPGVVYFWFMIPCMSVSAALNMIVFLFNNLSLYEHPRDISSSEYAQTAYDRAVELMNL